MKGRSFDDRINGRGWKTIAKNVNRKCFEDGKKRCYTCMISKEIYFEEDKINVDA